MNEIAPIDTAAQTTRKIQDILGEDNYYEEKSSGQVYIKDEEISDEPVKADYFTYQITKGDKKGQTGLTVTAKKGDGDKNRTKTVIGRQGVMLANMSSLKEGDGFVADTKIYDDDIPPQKVDGKVQDVVPTPDFEWTAAVEKDGNGTVTKNYNDAEYTMNVGGEEKKVNLNVWQVAALETDANINPTEVASNLTPEADGDKSVNVLENPNEDVKLTYDESLEITDQSKLKVLKQNPGTVDFEEVPNAEVALDTSENSTIDNDQLVIKADGSNPDTPFAPGKYKVVGGEAVVDNIRDKEGKVTQVNPLPDTITEFVVKGEEVEETDETQGEEAELPTLENSSSEVEVGSDGPSNASFEFNEPVSVVDKDGKITFLDAANTEKVLDANTDYTLTDGTKLDITSAGLTKLGVDRADVKYGLSIKSGQLASEADPEKVNEQLDLTVNTKAPKVTGGEEEVEAPSLTSDNLGEIQLDDSGRPVADSKVTFPFDEPVQVVDETNKQIKILDNDGKEQTLAEGDYTLTEGNTKLNITNLDKVFTKRSGFFRGKTTYDNSTPISIKAGQLASVEDPTKQNAKLDGTVTVKGEGITETEETDETDDAVKDPTKLETKGFSIPDDVKLEGTETNKFSVGHSLTIDFKRDLGTLIPNNIADPDKAKYIIDNVNISYPDPRKDGRPTTMSAEDKAAIGITINDQGDLVINSKNAEGYIRPNLTYTISIGNAILKVGGNPTKEDIDGWNKEFVSKTPTK